MNFLLKARHDVSSHRNSSKQVGSLGLHVILLGIGLCLMFTGAVSAKGFSFSFRQCSYFFSFPNEFGGFSHRSLSLLESVSCSSFCYNPLLSS